MYRLNITVDQKRYFVCGCHKERHFFSDGNVYKVAFNHYKDLGDAIRVYHTSMNVVNPDMMWEFENKFKGGTFSKISNDVIEHYRDLGGLVYKGG